ncbi:hypothetical protein FUAG_02528 [Fusobacterium ulcerans ATCC 49185]|uniref:Uncharacterized protein n=1 Tax=Fusobacterium ulcerans TaxID=861 RepID=A0AAX2JD24_9FUSO|nr:hypothetical protein [Fusobacterium ulcerans]EFS27013.2 hypothetical protein FUAG_02528 [Fusobacterium ulcerans ATCC 49185]SQJ03969.1 Uncharacterised protein [Fusobacterium ulcerans]
MKKEYNDIAKTYCKCGRFLYEQIGSKTRFPRGVSVIISGDLSQVECKCGEITKVSLK